MDTKKWTEREFLEIWFAAGEGVATETQLSQLNDWVVSDAEARKYLVRAMWSCLANTVARSWAYLFFAPFSQRLGLSKRNLLLFRC